MSDRLKDMATQMKNQHDASEAHLKVMVEGMRSSLAIQSQALLSKVLLPWVRKRLAIQVICHDMKLEEN